MFSESLRIQYYRTLLIQTKRGNYRGKTINAKPIFLLALLDIIENGTAKDNKFFLDMHLIACYEKCFSIYDPVSEPTLIYKPFFHLQHDGYWHIAWNNNAILKYPSILSMQVNVKHASLDNGLWDLLQSVDTRNILRQEIINYFF